MPLGGKIRIATLHASGALPPGAAERDWVLLAVTDDGVGIADDIIGKVFDPFFTTKGEAGSGLGLASVHGIVSALAGHVDITSSLGRGTTVTVAFPDEGRLPSSEAQPHETADTIVDRCVILVDDDEDVRVATAGVLRDVGFDVVEASTAYEGLAALAQCPRAVLVTDIVMPGGMNGLDLAGVVRREFPAVEVVLISAYAGALIGDRTPLPHRMLVKPVSTDDLLEALGEPRPLHAARSGERVFTDG
jgi:CheY-like chemotaxis protein